MIIKIFREYTPYDSGISAWEMTTFKRLVWEYDSVNETLRTTSDASPDNYVQGKLYAKVDDKEVSPPELDEILLSELDIDRACVEKHIRDAKI